MIDPKNSGQTKSPAASVSPDSPKKPYLKPAFRHEKVFETMALACGKVNATQGTCRFNRKNS
jgi:hypothetical protein